MPEAQHPEQPVTRPVIHYLSPDPRVTLVESTEPFVSVPLLSADAKPAKLLLRNIAECDELIRAGVAAKDLLTSAHGGAT